MLNLLSGNRESGKDSSDIGSLLHGDDSELILFVDPDEEGLLVVVEDTSSLRPVSVEATSIQESVAFFEEEVVSDQLVLLSLGHRAERIESTGELSLELAASLNNFLLNLVSLLSRDTWAKRIVCQVTSYSNSGGLDHGCVLSGEWWALKFGVVHVTDMASTLGMAMVLLDDLVHQWREGSVGVM